MMSLPKKKIWEQAQQQLGEVLNARAHDEVLKATYEGFESGRLLVGIEPGAAESPFWRNFRRLVQEKVKELSSDIRELRLITVHQDDDRKSGKEDSLAARESPESSTLFEEELEDSTGRLYRLQDFIAGDENYAVKEALRRIGAARGGPFNPVFLCSETGQGKTHLLRAFGNIVDPKNLENPCRYCSARAFIDSVSPNFQGQESESIRTQCKKVSVLLVDDIHLLIGQREAQMDLLDTVDYLLSRGRQIAFSADRKPNELLGFNEQLVNRFWGGLILEVKRPGFDTRCEILRHWATEVGLTLPFDVIEQVVINTSANISELRGVYLKIRMLCECSNQKANLAMVEDLFGDSKRRLVRQTLSVESVQDIVADHFHVTVEDLCGNNRVRKIALARQVAMYLCIKNVKGATQEEIAEKFGGKDHSTVLRARDKILQDLQENDDIRRDIEAIMRHLHEHYS